MCVYIYCMNGLALESVCIMHRCLVIQGTFDAICHLVTISEGDNRVSDPRLGNPTLRNSLCLRVFIATTLCGAFWNPASFVPTLCSYFGDCRRRLFSPDKGGPNCFGHVQIEKSVFLCVFEKSTCFYARLF